MVNMLFLPISIPLVYIYAIASILILILHWIWRYWDNIKNYYPEAGIFKKARKNGIALMQKWFMNGFFIFERIEKDKKGDMYAKLAEDSHEGIRFDPRIQSKAPKCFTEGGLEIYQYGSNTPYNFTALNAVASSKIIEHVRTNYKQLDFLQNHIILEYCSKPKNVLIQDCMNIVVMYNVSEDFNLSYEKVEAIKESIKEDIVSSMGTVTDEERINYEVEKEFIIQVQKMKAEKLAQVFSKIQSELIKMNLNDQYFSFADQFLNMASCITAVDMQTFKGYIDKLSELKREQFNMKFLVIVGFAIMLIVIGAGIFYTIVNGGI